VLLFRNEVAFPQRGRAINLLTVQVAGPPSNGSSRIAPLLTVMSTSGILLTVNLNFINY